MTVEKDAKAAALEVFAAELDAIHADLVKAVEAAAERYAERAQAKLRTYELAAEAVDLPVNVASTLASGGAVRLGEFEIEKPDPPGSYMAGRDHGVELTVGHRTILGKSTNDPLTLREPGRYRVVIVVQKMPPSLKETTGEKP